LARQPKALNQLVRAQTVGVKRHEDIEIFLWRWNVHKHHAGWFAQWGVLHQTQVPNEHIAKKRIIGTLRVVALTACLYLRRITRYTTRDTIEQAAWDNMIYCQYIVLTAVGALSLFSRSLVLAHSINRPLIVAHET
jgi:hypothetical protein